MSMTLKTMMLMSNTNTLPGEALWSRFSHKSDSGTLALLVVARLNTRAHLAPCIENRGIEDNFIFYIECYFFFIHVMKYKCGNNISKLFQSILCLILDLWYILTENPLWFGKKSTFLTQNILLRAIAGLFSFPTIIVRKNGKKYNFSAGAKLGRSRFSHSKTPKYAKNWLFLAIFSFFLFLRSTFFTLGTKKSQFCSSNVG